MHISLTERLETWVRQKVESGLYNNASEVVREALRARMLDEQSVAANRAALREAIKAGLDDIDAGRTEPWDRDAFLAELDAEA